MQENWYDWAVRTKDYLHNATLSPRQFDAEKNGPCSLRDLLGKIQQASRGSAFRLLRREKQ